MEPGTIQELTILAATCEHIDLLLDFRREMIRDMGKKDEEQIEGSIAELKPWLLDRMGESGRLYVPVGCVDGVPVACAIAWVYDWYPALSDRSTSRGYIFNVYTHPDWRRRGFAGQMVQACVEWFREKGIKNIRLHASEYGQSVYARIGFRSPQYREMVLRL